MLFSLAMTTFSLYTATHAEGSLCVSLCGVTHSFEQHHISCISSFVLRRALLTPLPIKQRNVSPYGTHQCVLAVRESLLKELGTVVDDLVIEQVIRTGTADIGEKYLTVIRKTAGDYTKEIFHKLREREYNPELMRLYVVGGGGCMIQNFGEYDKNRVTIVRDICATAKGYEAMTVRKIQRNGGMLV